MPGYKVPLREFRYVLHEVLGAEAHYRALGRDDVNAELIEGVLEGAARFAEDVIAPTNEPGDRIGVRRDDDGRVVTPPGFVDAYRQYVDDGWAALCGPVAAGGQGLPESIGGVVGEMLVSANMSWKLYSGLTDSAVLSLDHHGSGEMKRVYLPKLVSGVWSGTMVLTEPHAGTDLGLMRTRAEPQADGSYRVTGTKIFITSGEHDLTENIVHMVLAKLPDAPSGSRGISMFLVPKFLPDAAGAPGDANGVSCASVEHKLGIHGFRDLRDELRRFAGLADRRGQRRPQVHVHDDEPRTPLGGPAGARPVRARLAGLARLCAGPAPGAHVRGRQVAGRSHHRPPGRAPDAADPEIAHRRRARADLVRGPADGPRAASSGRRATRGSIAAPRRC